MNKEEITAIIYEELDDIIACRKIAEEILEPLIYELKLKIKEQDELLSDSRILKEAYFIAKGKKEAYQELKGLLEYE